MLYQEEAITEESDGGDAADAPVPERTRSAKPNASTVALSEQAPTRSQACRMLDAACSCGAACDEPSAHPRRQRRRLGCA